MTGSLKNDISINKDKLIAYFYAHVDADKRN